MEVEVYNRDAVKILTMILEYLALGVVFIVIISLAFIYYRQMMHKSTPEIEVIPIPTEGGVKGIV